jgi:rod shape-determining protein MreD
MNYLHTILLLGVSYLVVFLEATWNGPRSLLGVQVDLLPSLIIYTSLTCGPVTLALVAFLGGLWFDSLSANPLGISILPLFAVGFWLQYYRGLILREQRYAQWVLGLGGSALAPLLTLLLLLNTEKQPVLGWFSLWQWLVMAILGGLFTPVWFYVLDWLMQALSYKEMDSTSFRPDREIKRGRS